VISSRTRPSGASTAALRVLALACALGLLAAACGSGGGSENADGTGPDDTGQSTNTLPPASEEEPQPGGSLVYGLAAETNGWDPTLSQWGPWGLTVAKTFFDTLTVFDEDGTIHPYLAESFTPNDDFTSWDIKLRPGVTFHNGEELTAEVLKANWDFYAESPLVGRIFAEIESTEIVDDLTMRANLTQKWVNFPEAWTTQIGVVMATEMLEADNATRAQNPIGTGPFVFQEWEQDNHLTVVRNDDYWREGLPYLDSIEFRPLVDPTSRASALRSGEVDLAQLEEPPEQRPFIDDPNFVLWQDDTAETAESFVMLNTLQAPLDDLRVRQALAYATDKETMNLTISDGEREVANGPYRPTSPWYTETDYPQFDPAAAQALVEEYEAEVGPIEFTLEVGVSGALGAQTAQLLQEQWSAVGIDAQVGSSEISTMIASIVGGNYDAVVWRQFDSPTPLQETVWWHEEGAPDIGEVGLNFARNRNAELSEALDRSRTQEDDEARKDDFAFAQEQLAADIPYIWITHIESAIVADSSVQGVFYATVPDTGERVMSLHNSSHLLSEVWLDQTQE
jgi:ABC-type transport system substrate-binding protein